MSSLLVIGMSLALLGGLAGAAEARRPNLILILADDLGYETLGANGGTSYRTPALDQLAATGARFTHCYPMILTHAPYQPTPDSRTWDPGAKGEAVNQAKAHFGDMVAYMDKLVGQLVEKLGDLGLRKDTLILFTGDNGTGKGTRSMIGGREVIGGKGSTTAAGMHVPLIANWPGRVVGGNVCSDLVDTTDFLPTLLEAARAPPPDSVKLDGRSFLPQLRGERGRPREWIYSWYSPRQGADLTVREFAFNQRFKLYRTDEFYDLSRDLEEAHPLTVATLGGDAAAAARLLQGALDQFRGVRPAALDRVPEAAGQTQATPENRNRP